VKHNVQSETADVHWYEGMFLMPHHHQSVTRRNSMMEKEKTTSLIPFYWGIVDLQINPTALSGKRIKVDRAVLRLKDGTWINVPDNARVADKSFEDKISQLDESLDVWFAVRRPEAHRPLVHPLGEETYGRPRTFVLKESNIADENSGENEQLIQSRLWNVQVFVGEKPGDEFESLKIGELTWSSAKLPVFIATYIPSLLRVAASEFLRDRTKNLVVKLTNQASFLQRELAAKQITLTSDPIRIYTNLSRLQISCSYGLVLQQLLNVDNTHPFQLYLELVRLAGELVSVQPDITLEIPPYNHDNLGVIMETVIKLVERMIEGGVIVDYIHRRFEIEGLQRVCRIDKEWIEPEPGAKVHIFLCISTDMTEQNVDAMLSDYRVKISPPSRIDDLLISRVRGLSCARLRRIPSGLPDRTGLHYFQMDLSNTSEYWQDLYRDLSLAIHGIPVEYTSDISLYVNIEKGTK
jgi:type VI secretion system protein ImpJ